MQSNNEVIQNPELNNNAQAALRTWIKPEAKIAEVAQVTLSGIATFNENDLGATCAS